MGLPMEHSALDREIDNLETLFRDAYYGGTRWKDVWDKVKFIGACFKETRYPTREGKQDAWERFQNIVSEGKQLADRSRESFNYHSENIRDSIIQLVDQAINFDPTGADLFASIFALAIPGVNLGAVYDMVAGEWPWLTSQKEILRARSNFMQQAWAAYSENKHRLTRGDRDTLLERLRYTKDVLDRDWEQWKAQTQEMKERKHAEYLERQASRRQRIEDNIEKNRERLSKLRGVLENKMEYMDRLVEQRDNARTDGFRYAMEEKIQAVSGQIDEIEEKISNVLRYIEEDRDKLSGM